MASYYGEEFGRGRRGMRGMGNYGYGRDLGPRGDYDSYPETQYEGEFGGYAGARGYPGVRGYGQGGFDRDRQFGRGWGGRESGMGMHRPTGYEGAQPGWGGRPNSYDFGYQTPAAQYGSRTIERGGGRFGQQRSGGLGTRAGDLMTENPECVTPDTPISEVAKKMRSLDVGIIPVVQDMDDRRLSGVVTDRDLAIRALAEGKDGKLQVSECMTQDVRTVNKNDSVDAVIDVMRSEQVRRVPVTDREGRLVGIIAQADLAVDYAGRDDVERELQVEDTLERISEPGRPRRGAFRR